MHLMKMRVGASLVVAGLMLSMPVVQADFIGHGGMVRSVDVSPDGSRVITGSFDYTARVWSFGDQTEIAVLDHHEGPVTSVTFGPSGKRALTTSDDFTAFLWDMDTFQPIHRLSGHKHKVMTSTFSKNGKMAATGAWDRSIKVWDLETGKETQSLTAKSPVNAVRSAPSTAATGARGLGMLRCPILR